MSKNTIPLMDHPLSSAWHQPSTDLILIDDTHALMEQSTFDQLREYSTSQPTGAYEGKMWKGNINARRLSIPEWYLAWFGKSDKPGYVSTYSREILIV